MHDERPAKPNLDRLDRIKQWHTPAMNIFDRMFDESENNLRKGHRTVSNAAVNLESFRQELSWKHRLHWAVIKEIERSLVAEGVIEKFGGYAKRKQGK